MDDEQRPKPGVRGTLVRYEPVLYAIIAGAWTLGVACLFYSSIRLQTHLGSISMRPEGFEAAINGALMGEWSAPLDDVFIHFDFARAAARGYPFEWSEGNGYSSGGTSLLYPFVLALGYWVGFRDLKLVVWAGVVACVCVFGTLLAARRLFRNLPRWTSYLAPPVFLGVGALSWTLFSGMEVALLLAFWAGALVAWDDLLNPEDPAAASPGWTAAVLGIWGAALVATRPEGAVAVAVFSISGGIALWKRRGVGAALRTVLASAVPGACVVLAHGIANHLITGDFSAAGAVAKLEAHHPHLTREQVWDAWEFHLGYQVLRVTHYHLSEVPGWGWILWALAAVGLFSKRTRRYSLALWLSAGLWIIVVAFNGQVRWQNERYTMPAVAWLVLAAALGIGVLVGSRPARGKRGWALRTAMVLGATTAVGLLVWQHELRYREQVWFFGRASRNIRDQHVLTGRLLRRMSPEPTRVLVGDAGAIPYTSDLPALDIIGLGGYRTMPFARATRWGVAGSIELIERIPPQERPDVLAIYPSWWGSFPLWFGTRVFGVPVRGNVICGGHTKMVYRPTWEPLERSGIPFRVPEGHTIVDAIDFADLISEKEHEYVVSEGVIAFLGMKMLPDPREPRRDLWDGGRSIPKGAHDRFSIRNLRAGEPAKLVVRAAAAQPTVVGVRIDGRDLPALKLQSVDGWEESTIDVPADAVREVIEVQLESKSRGRTLYHLWATQRR